MKFKQLVSVVALSAIIFGGATVMAQVPVINGGNPGIVMAGSQKYTQLPEKAKKFIEKHFKDIAVRSCEKYFAKGKYEVELVNGMDLDFDAKGNILEIDAPTKTVLPVPVVKDILPSKAYDRLVKDGLNTMVESIEFKRGKAYEVELNTAGPDTYIFDINGVFIAIED